MNALVRFQLVLRTVYATTVSMVPVVAVLFVHEVYFGFLRNPAMLTVLQVYSVFIIAVSLLHLVPLTMLSHGRRTHNVILLVLVVLAHGLIIGLASIHASTPVYVLFVAPAILLLCYHAIENDVHA